MSKSRKLTEYEASLMTDLGSGLSGSDAGKAALKLLKKRVRAKDKLASQFIEFHAQRGLTDAYNRHWHSKVVNVVKRGVASLVHIRQGQPVRDAAGKPMRGAIQVHLFDFETIEDLQAARERIRRSRDGQTRTLELFDYVLTIWRKHPDLTARGAAQAEGIDPNATQFQIGAA